TFDCAPGEHERFRDLAVREALGDEPDDLDLAVREAQLEWRALATHDQVIRDEARPAAGHGQLTARRPEDRAAERLAVEILRQETARPGLDGLDEQAVGGRGGEDDDRGLWQAATDLGDDRHGALPAQVDIE